MKLLGVDGAGYEATAPLMVEGRMLPWLLDTTLENAWVRWGVEYRDVVIIDAAGKKRGVYNLTLHDLTLPANAAELERLLLDAR